MPDFLKGNYELPHRKRRSAGRKPKASLTEQFEKQALAKLGGSLCFVTKRGHMIWSGEADGAPGAAAH